MDSNDKYRLQTMIKKILHAHSGGMKITELVVDLVSAIKEVSDSIETKNLAQELDILLAEMPGIGILEYRWDMSGDGSGPFRGKSFVYTK